MLNRKLLHIWTMYQKNEAALTVSLPYQISRSLGKGLAKLTFDEEYQKQRARRMAQKPAHIGEGYLLSICFL